jgi:hypothetical protein
MARNRKDKNGKIPLKQPDRSGPDPSQETLLEMAEQRGLLNIPQAVGKGKNKAEPAADEEPLIGRLGESMLWTFSLTMLHFSMDVLVARQYAVEIEWDKLFKRSLQAFPGVFTPMLLPKIMLICCTNSIPLPLLLPASAPVTLDPPPTHTNTTDSPTAILLHSQCIRRQLPHTHHKPIRVLCSTEASTSSGMSLDLVGD